MNDRLTKIFIVFFFASVFSTLHSADGIKKSLSKDTAKVFIISPKDKETVENPITVIFGIEDMEMMVIFVGVYQSQKIPKKKK